MSISPERGGLRPTLNGLATARRYQRAWLRDDVLAGITVAAYLIPQSMAYAGVAGLPPAAGLWASVPAMAAYALFGSSSRLSVGPESTTALMTAAALAPLAGGDATRYTALAALLAIIVGAFSLAAWVARLGFVADLLSRPVLIGYLAGVAASMVVGQLSRLTGVPVDGERVPVRLWSFASRVGDVRPAPVLVAAAVLAGLYLVSHRWRRAPGPLLAVAAATAAVAAFHLDRRGVAVIGPLGSGVPRLGVGGVRLADVRLLAPVAAGIAVVGYTDNMLTARAFSAGPGGGEAVDANTELLALGVANVACGLAQGFPVSSSASRTALAVALRARTQLYSLVAAGTVVAAVLGGRGVIARIPAAALGAVVVYAASRMVAIDDFRRLARFRRTELALALATLGAVLVLDILYGVLVALVLSVVDLLARVARPHDAILGLVPGLAGMHDVDDYPKAAEVPGLLVYRYDAPLFFANADDFRRRALLAVETRPVPVRWFIFNVEGNVEVDLTALDALEQLRAELAARGIMLGLARVKQDLLVYLRACGLADAIGEDHMYPTLPTAVAAYREWEAAGRPPVGGAAAADGAAGEPPGAQPPE
ncbi:MAG: SulP family inorganic anion transporter [Acidimicrobiia bacterium]|nr:SulP family inorganic anion transporter [Acidimicrobiia bacterium]MDH4363967.1 SulP family inorganic anion transporter [Acidimicrobiia bacterium]MDH5289685.1 SulP family inorganic anion transporter [Acidimicrobiia bacterium]